MEDLIRKLREHGVIQCGSNRRSTSAAGEVDNSNSERKTCGYGIGKFAKDAKRVSSKPTETDKDKYAFQCFLLRLGFIEKEYKIERKMESD